MELEETQTWAWIRPIVTLLGHGQKNVAGTRACFCQAFECCGVAERCACACASPFAFAEPRTRSVFEEREAFFSTIQTVASDGGTAARKRFNFIVRVLPSNHAFWAAPQA